MYHVGNPSTDLAAPPVPGQPRSGRSARRSRLGCVVCKERRVRCDEGRPVCGHCTRLQLDCVYLLRPRKKARTASVPNEVTDPGQDLDGSHDDGQINPAPPVQRHSNGTGINIHEPQQVSHFSTSRPAGSAWSCDGHSCSHVIDKRKARGYSDGQLLRQDPNVNAWKGASFAFPSPNVDFFDFATIGAFDAPNPENSFGTFMFADTPWHSPPLTNNNSSGSNNALVGQVGTNSSPSLPQAHQTNNCGCPPAKHARPLTNGSRSERIPLLRRSSSVIPASVSREDARAQYLLSYFQRIVQPPAAILVGGVHKWRRLQSYLVRVSDSSRAVANALFALIEVLAHDEVNSDQEGSMVQALERHDSASREVEFELSRLIESDQKTKDHLLAAVFLLAWFEVIRDQVADHSLFPSELADRIITCNASWNPYSKQLLQWLNTLDSKATHLGGHHLLSPEALRVVAQHPTQISTSDGSDEGEDGTENPDDSANHPSTGSNPFSPAQTSHPHHHGSSPECSQPGSTGPTLRQVKQIMLNTILQPALEWYLTTQSYNRRISSLDRHHRSRGSVKDEYDVITASKQLETELFKLWRQRPMVITLTASQLSNIVSTDVAVRLEEIFCIYLASFWILFVFLHRVSWWTLPHSETAQGALEEAWRSLRHAYGEIINGGQKKVVHPALLWPLFLFGSECVVESQRNWAIDQLEALGEAKPVIGEDEADDALPPFRLSAGATRNSKRAALLLRELVKRQNELGGRVDDRDLSVELFGCHFSII